MKKYLSVCAAACTALLACVAAQAAGSGEPPVWRTVSFQGNDVLYQESGNPEAQALVFIHGWACDSSFWRCQIPEFGEYRVIAIDLPGFGRSARPGNVLYTLPYFAGAVRAVVEHAGLNAPVLIGHSMGYAIARQYLIQYPESVRALVNVDGTYFRRPSSPDARRGFEKEVAGMLADLEGPQRARVMESIVEATFYGKTPPELREEIKAAMLATDAYASTSSLREMLKLDQWRERNFSVPCLALYAQADDLPPKHEVYLRSVFPDLVYQEWADSGHYLMLEQPRRFNAALRSYLESLAQ